MNYLIRSPTAMGDVVGLINVVEAMANVRATAGEGYHHPTYVGAKKGFTATLVHAANSGQLVVCDQFNAEMSPELILQKARVSRSISDSPADESQTFVLNVCVSLGRLNQWGAERGDTFALVEKPWLDERGWQGLSGKEPPPREFEAAPAKTTTPASVSDVVEPASDGPARAKRSRKPSWSVVAMPYMQQLYKNGKFKSATVFYKALLSRVDTPDSPFTKYSGELYCKEGGTTVAEGTVGKVWAEIRGR